MDEEPHRPLHPTIPASEPLHAKRFATPHSILADARAAFSRKGEKGRARRQLDRPRSFRTPVIRSISAVRNLP
jgi:hypothetical protein